MMNKTVWIMITVVAVLVIGGMSSYNSLVNMSENVNGKWS
jgi:LemA protein